MFVDTYAGLSLQDTDDIAVQQKLAFPTPTATAYTIQSLHATATPSTRRSSSKKIRIIGMSFAVSLAFKTLASYFPGVLWDWHVFWWLYSIGFRSFIGLESWGWWIGELSEVRSRHQLTTNLRMDASIFVRGRALGRERFMELHGRYYLGLGYIGTSDGAHGCYLWRTGSCNHERAWLDELQ